MGEETEIQDSDLVFPYSEDFSEYNTESKQMNSSPQCHFTNFLLGDLWRLFFVSGSEPQILMLKHLWLLQENFCKILSRLLKKVALLFQRL